MIFPGVAMILGVVMILVVVMILGMAIPESKWVLVEFPRDLFYVSL